MKTKFTKFCVVTLFVSGVSVSAFAQQLTSSQEQTLKDTGWSVQQDADGSLILNRAHNRAKLSEDNDAPGNNWLNIQQELQAAGWNVDRESDGTLILIPPSPSEPLAEVVQEVHPMSELQQKLQQAGWTVTNNDDGSLSLYPREDLTSSQPLPSKGIAPAIKISLPVDNWQEAHDIAKSWLSNQPLYNASVGKIRMIFRVYIVSIVADEAPYTLLQQIAIRNSDGAIIVLN